MIASFQVSEFRVSSPYYPRGVSEFNVQRTPPTLGEETVKLETLKLTMRKILGVTVLLLATAVTSAQQPAPPAPRYGVPARLDTFPQATPKETLTSVLKAIGQGRTDYLAAQLIEPKFIDAETARRGRLLEPAVEVELRARRESQWNGPNPPPRAERLPIEPEPFAEAVRQEALLRAFRLVVRDIAATLTANPDHVKDFRRFLREGTFIEGGETASATLKDVKDRQVNFRKIGSRWYIEDRKQPMPAGT
jgi:hypothetical protein